MERSLNLCRELAICFFLAERRPNVEINSLHREMVAKEAKKMKKDPNVHKRRADLVRRIRNADLEPGSVIVCPPPRRNNIRAGYCEIVRTSKGGNSVFMASPRRTCGVLLIRMSHEQREQGESNTAQHTSSFFCKGVPWTRFVLYHCQKRRPSPRWIILNWRNSHFSRHPRIELDLKQC